MRQDHPATGKHPRGKGPRTKKAKARRRASAEARREAEKNRLELARRVVEK